MPHEKKAPSEKTYFQARREEFHQEAHGGEHGGTEMGWLVSYADMMTLLFGLFVILFSIKVDGKRGVDDVMREVSKKYFSDMDQGGDAPKGLGSSESSEKPLTTHESVEEIQNLHKSLQERTAEVERLNAEYAKDVESLKKENEELKTKTQSASRRYASIEAKESEASRQMQNEMEELRQELYDMGEALKEKNEEVLRNKSPHQNYMMTLLTWDTEKHDVDLQIMTPNKKNFNFKRRRIAGEPGNFELDSRYGPGIEMWKAENFVSGTYAANVSLYNRNGNEADARVQFTVVTNLGTYKSPQIILNSQKNIKKVTFEVDSQGVVRFEN